ncbi:MAG TPA: hypothetical protein VEW69_10555, partial [Alphaproteobacteria bacterium]|nr:hypothetical protein [Alphaproteobacteria bacterium]
DDHSATVWATVPQLTPHCIEDRSDLFRRSVDADGARYPTHKQSFLTDCVTMDLDSRRSDATLILAIIPEVIHSCQPPVEGLLDSGRILTIGSARPSLGPSSIAHNARQLKQSF